MTDEGAKDGQVENVDIARDAAELTDKTLEDFQIPVGGRNQAATAFGNTAVGEAIDKARLREESLRDSLTGLPNKRRFDERINTEFADARRYARPLTLLMLDLDHFKEVNDTYGHPVGNLALIEFAARAKNELRRPADFLARYGGEEFIIILSDTDTEGAKQVAELILQSASETPFAIVKNGLTITTSIGVASLDLSMTNPQELIKAADGAMYRAKQLGRNRVEAYQSPTP